MVLVGIGDGYMVMLFDVVEFCMVSGVINILCENV